MIKDLLKAIYKPLIVILLIAVAGFLFIHFLWPKTPTSVTLPGGTVIPLDTKGFTDSVKQILKKVDENGRKVNDLESAVRQLQTHTVEKEIPEALKETNVRASVERMKAAW